MARDVEANLTASDKTGTAIASAERRFRQSQERMRREQEKSADKQRDLIKDQLGRFSSLIEGISPKFAAGLAKTLAGAGDAVGPVLLGAVIATAPLIGATLSAAVIGGAAGAGIVGGVLLAVRDARVQAAGKQLGQNLLSSLEQDAAPFVQPLLDAIDLIDERFRESQSTIQSIFAGASRFVRPLVDGITRGVQAVMRGIDNAVQHAGPVIDVIGQGIAQLGGSIEAFLNRISQNAPAAAAALATIFDIIDFTIRAIAVGLDLLTRVYGFAAKTGLLGAQAQAQMISYEADLKIAKAGTDQLGASFEAAAPKATALHTAIAPLAPNLQDIAAATRAVHTANLDLYSSETAVAQAVADANAKIKENGRTLSLTSQKGRENRQALSQVASALQNQYDKYVQVNGVGTRSAAVADNLRAQFIKLARQAGLSAGKAQDLANRILDIPSSHDTKITARNEKALEAAREVRRAINSLPSSKVIDVAIRVTGTKAARSAVQAALNKQSARFDANSSWAPADGSMRNRGRADPVEVNNTLEVSLDGRPFREYTWAAIDANGRRERWRRKVGAR